MATVDNSERWLGPKSRFPGPPLRETMSTLPNARFVIRATRFHRGTPEDRTSIVRELLDSTDAIYGVARMAAFLAGYCGVETAAEFCGLVKELQGTGKSAD